VEEGERRDDADDGEMKGDDGRGGSVLGKGKGQAE